MRTDMSRKRGGGTVLMLLSLALVARAAGAQSAPKAAPRTVEEVVQRYVAALGGEQALRRHTSRHVVMVMRMKLADTLPETETRSEQFVLAPDKVLLRMSMGPGTMEFGFDGTVGWSQSEFTGAQRLDSARVAGLRRMANPVPSYGAAREVAFLGPRDFEGKATVAIRWVTDSTVVNIDYYDIVSGLKLGSDAEPSEGVGAATRVRYEDYRWVDGERVAMTLTMLSNGKVMITQRVTAVEHAPPDARLFTPPASLSPAP